MLFALTPHTGELRSTPHNFWRNVSALSDAGTNRRSLGKQPTDPGDKETGVRWLRTLESNACVEFGFGMMEDAFEERGSDRFTVF